MTARLVNLQRHLISTENNVRFSFLDCGRMSKRYGIFCEFQRLPWKVHLVDELVATSCVLLNRSSLDSGGPLCGNDRGHTCVRDNLEYLRPFGVREVFLDNCKRHLGSSGDNVVLLHPLSRILEKLILGLGGNAEGVFLNRCFPLVNMDGFRGSGDFYPEFGCALSER